MEKYCDENVKYRKKKDSSKSKSSSKAKHKHSYEKCIIVECGKYHFVTIKSYCTICGKVGDTHLDDISVKSPNGSYRLLKKEEILEKYKSLRLFCVDSIFDKYVGL